MKKTEVKYYCDWCGRQMKEPETKDYCFRDDWGYFVKIKLTVIDEKKNETLEDICPSCKRSWFLKLANEIVVEQEEDE